MATRRPSEARSRPSRRSVVADDLAGGFMVDGGWTLDAMGATAAMPRPPGARRGYPARLRGEADPRRGRTRHRAGHGRGGSSASASFSRRAWLRLLLRPWASSCPSPRRAAGSSRPAASTRPALCDRAGALADAGRDGERRRRTDGARDRGRRGRRARRRLAAPRRAAGWSLPHRHVAPAVALDDPEGPEPFAGWPSAPPAIARTRGRSRDRRLVRAPCPHPDGLPVVGPVPGVEGLVVAGGFSSIGMVTAPAACRRLAAGDADLFDPGRFAAN